MSIAIFGGEKIRRKGRGKQGCPEAARTSGAEILKVGHHGSRTSSSPTFLAKVKPEVAVIMAGAKNSYGHPHKETLDKFEQSKTKVYRTDLDGTIVVTTDGKKYEVTTVKHEKGKKK